MGLGGPEEGTAGALPLSLALALALTLRAVATHLVLPCARIVRARPPASSAAWVVLAPVLVLRLRLVILVATSLTTATHFLALVAASAIIASATTDAANCASAATPGMDFVFALSWLVPIRFAIEAAVAHAIVLAMVSVPVATLFILRRALLLVVASVGVATPAASRSASSTLIVSAPSAASERGASTALTTIVRLTSLITILIPLLAMARSSTAPVVVAAAAAAVERATANSALVRLAPVVVSVLAATLIQ